MKELITKEELIENIRNICPNMLDHENFIHVAELIYCNGDVNDGTNITEEEYKNWYDFSDKMCSATVGQLVDYLKKNFNENDKICYMDCVEGLKNDCTYVSKEQLGKRFFYYAVNLSDKITYNFPYVDGNDVVVT